MQNGSKACGDRGARCSLHTWLLKIGIGFVITKYSPCLSGGLHRVHHFVIILITLGSCIRVIYEYACLCCRDAVWSSRVCVLGCGRGVH